MEQNTIEQHPKRHDWYRATDFVTDKNTRGRVIGVRRVEECRYCPTTKVTLIDTNLWERKGHPYYKYRKGVVIQRIDPREFLKRLFFATTDLSPSLFGK